MTIKIASKDCPGRNEAVEADDFFREMAKPATIVFVGTHTLDEAKKQIESNVRMDFMTREAADDAIRTLEKQTFPMPFNATIESGHTVGHVRMAAGQFEIVDKNVQWNDKMNARKEAPK